MGIILINVWHTFPVLIQPEVDDHLGRGDGPTLWVICFLYMRSLDAMQRTATIIIKDMRIAD